MLDKVRPQICPLLGAPMPTTVCWPDTNRVSKSGARVLEILEWFSDNRRPAIAQEIAQVLGLPVSSAADLLKSLVETGHLLFDKDNKTYFPSPRVLRLSLSVLPYSMDSAGLSGIVRKLQARTGACVSVSAQNGRHMQFVHILPTPGVVLNEVHEGLKFPIVGTASGIAILATKADTDVISLVRKATAGSAARAREETIQSTLQQVRLARKRGYAVSFFDQLQYAMSVAVTLNEPRAHYPLALCAGGSKANFQGREQDIADIMRQVISDYLHAKGDASFAG